MSIEENENDRRTFCQIPFTKINENAEKGKESLKHLIRFIKHAAKAERTASEQLRSLLLHDKSNNIYTEELEGYGTSIRSAIVQTKTFFQAQCHQDLTIANAMEEHVAEPLLALQLHAQSYVCTLQQELYRVHEKYDQEYEAMLQANDQVLRLGMDLEEAQARQRRALHCIGIPAFELQRLALRVRKCREELDIAKSHKANCKRAVYDRIIARDEMGMAVAMAYQKAEEERLDQIKTSLKRLVYAEKSRLKNMQAQLELLESSIENIDQAADIQLVVHDHSIPDNMHFQGKALALLDWHWQRSKAMEARPARINDKDSDEESQDWETGLKDILLTSKEPIQTADTKEREDNEKMEKALRCFFQDQTKDLTTSHMEPLVPREETELDSACDIIKTLCRHRQGRMDFVKGLSHQRGFQTRIKSDSAFHALIACFEAFLTECMREDHVRVAKTAIILSETFYIAREDYRAALPQDFPGPGHHLHAHNERSVGRIYLQQKVKQHPIWKSPKFWEKALLLAVGEELQKTALKCPWEDLPSGNTHDSSVYTREEAVSHVHNIVFGQLGSFTLSMLEFEVPFPQIEAFIETMCDAHELTEEQRFLLRKSLQEIIVVLR